MATPTIETELPIYRLRNPPLFTVLAMEPKMVFLAEPMLLDKQLRACSMGYKIDREIQEPTTPESTFFTKPNP